jgi:hypothetical protein
MFIRSKIFRILVTILAALSLPTLAFAQKQPANEVQVQNQGEADLIDFFDGCKPKVKQSCQTRIVCTGSHTIHGNNARSVQTAMKIASAKANSELSKYLGNKNKVLEDIKILDKTYSKDDSQGVQTKQELGELTSIVMSTSAEQFLQGVAVIGGKVDMTAGKVTVVVGQGCDSVAIAQGMSRKMQQGQAQQSGGVSGVESTDAGSGVGGPQIHNGAPASVMQRPTNDF